MPPTPLLPFPLQPSSPRLPPLVPNGRPCPSLRCRPSPLSPSFSIAKTSQLTQSRPNKPNPLSTDRPLASCISPSSKPPPPPSSSNTQPLSLPRERARPLLPPKSCKHPQMYDRPPPPSPTPTCFPTPLLARFPKPQPEHPTKRTPVSTTGRLRHKANNPPPFAITNLCQQLCFPLCAPEV